jgi:hypothetical protein
MVQKGRDPVGEAIFWKVKLTNEKVLAIRQRRSEGVGVKELAAEFGVHFTTIVQVAKGRTWKHIPVLASPTRRKKSARNTSGFLGVTLVKSVRHWQAQIKVNGKTRYLGSFDSPEEASSAYEAAVKQFDSAAPPTAGT